MKTQRFGALSSRRAGAAAAGQGFAAEKFLGFGFATNSVFGIPSFRRSGHAASRHPAPSIPVTGFSVIRLPGTRLPAFGRLDFR